MEKYMPNEISTAAATLGRKGGASKSPAKRAAVRENGRKGGRPRTRPYCEDCDLPIRGELYVADRVVFDEAVHEATLCQYCYERWHAKH